MTLRGQRDELEDAVTAAVGAGVEVARKKVVCMHLRHAWRRVPYHYLSADN